MSDMDFTYQINPCGTVSGSKCSGSNIVVCQEWSGGSKVLGVAENRTITQVSGGVDIRVSGGAPASQCDGEPNNSEIEIVCEQGVPPYFTFDRYDAATCTWMFKAKTSAGCGPAPPPTPPSPPSPPAPPLWEGQYTVSDEYACNTTVCCCPAKHATVIVGESVDPSGSATVVMEALSVGACASPGALWTAKGQLASKNTISASFTFSSAITPTQGTASIIGRELTVIQQSSEQCYFTAS